MSAPRRRSIDVAGLQHGSNPIPAAARIGPFVATGAVRGVDRHSGLMPDGLDAQVQHMFANLVAVLDAAGASPDDVLRITVFARSGDARAPVNAAWLALFPDPASRPARHFQLLDLGHGMLVQCDALAVLSSNSGATP